MFAADIYQAPHLKYADIVLPACTSYEQSDQISVKNVKEGTWIGIYNKIVDLWGVTLRWQIYLDLALKGLRCGFLAGHMVAVCESSWAFRNYTGGESSPRGIFVKREQIAHQTQYRKYELLFKDLPHSKVQCYNEFHRGKDCSDGSSRSIIYLLFGAPEGIAVTPDLSKNFLWYSAMSTRTASAAQASSRFLYEDITAVSLDQDQFHATLQKFVCGWRLGEVESPYGRSKLGRSISRASHRKS